MMKQISAVLCAVLLLAFQSAYSQSNHSSIQTFVAYLSPLTTAKDLQQMDKDLLSKNAGVQFDNPVFSDKGFLISLDVSMKRACETQSISYQSKIDFSTTVFPLAVIWVGEECSHGLISTTYRAMPNQLGILFRMKKPDFATFAWSGSFERMKEYNPHASDVSLANSGKK